MQVPIEICIQDIEVEDELKEVIYKRVDKLNKVCPGLISCRVRIEQPHRGRHHGNQYRVAIDLTLPGHELNVHEERQDVEVYEDVSLSVRSAFEKATRLLKKHMEKKRKKA